MDGWNVCSARDRRIRWIKYRFKTDISHLEKGSIKRSKQYPGSGISLELRFQGLSRLEEGDFILTISQGLQIFTNKSNHIGINTREMSNHHPMRPR